MCLYGQIQRTVFSDPSDNLAPIKIKQAQLTLWTVIIFVQCTEYFRFSPYG